MFLVFRAISFMNDPLQKRMCTVKGSHFEVMLAEVLYADIQVTFHKINTKNSRKDPKEYILVTLV